MFSASTKAASLTVPATPDPQFNYVTMLLHGDGTNGAQNNTFLDSSTNNFTITRNGNTTQGSFSPYGSNWSNYFGTGGYKLSTTGMTQLGSDFTVEFWTYPTSFNDYNNIFDNRTADADTAGMSFGLTSAGKVYFYTNLTFQITTATAISLNTWTHLALVRSGSGSGNVKIYINGVADSNTATYTTSFTSTAPSIGDDWNTRSFLQYFGYLSNLRATNAALYTSTFTPSTVPLTTTVSSGTCLLLTCQSNRFIDNSASALTMTVTGSPSVQRFNPFGTSTAYSTNVIGGSGYFDDNGDFLTSTGVAIGTGNLTYEFWIYPLDGSVSYNCVYDTRVTGDVVSGMGIFQYGNVIEIYQATLVVASAANAIAINAWNHVAFVRNSGTCQLYVNGVASGASNSNTTNLTSTERRIGTASTSSVFLYYGYISDLRENSTALYTSTFTPPTAPLTAVTNTTLLLNYTNGAIFDNAMMNDLETVGNAQISTSVVKYGTGSLYFDGTGDYLVAPNNPAYLFNTGDFTVELYWYPTALTGTPAVNQLIVGMWGGGTSQASWLLYFSGGSLYWYTSNNGSAQVASITAASGLSINNWYHIALVRSSGTTKIYVNGTSIGSTSTVVNLFNATCSLIVGYNPIGGTPDYLHGYIDDLRITKGFARYTANFTPPTAAFPNTGPY